MESPERQIKTATPFPFYKLPQEIQLNVFDQMNMTVPEGKVYWSVFYGFYHKQFENKSLFSVNKDFYFKAREMFWSQNHFIVCPDTRRAGELFEPEKPEDPDSPPNRYAGTIFLDQFLHG